MIIQPSPNQWSCMPAAFATATGLDISSILRALGHDGSEVVFPDLDEPFCRRGFTGQELVLALHSLGWLACEIQFEPFAVYDEAHAYTIEYSEEKKSELSAIINDSIGVIAVEVTTTGSKHAVAWDGERCYDPTGFIYPLSKYIVEVYYKLVRVE